MAGKEVRAVDAGGEGAGHGSDKRTITGSVSISGEIKGDLSPMLMQEYRASNAATDRREKQRRSLEIATFVSVVVVAVFSGIQTRQAIRSADAASDASRISSRALYVSERAYVNLGEVSLDLQHGLVAFAFHNTGHIPSGAGKVTLHGITVTCQEAVTDCPSHHYSNVSRWWRELPIAPIPSSNPARVSTELYGIDADRLASGSQSVILAGEISYGDGFSANPDQNSPFCVQTVFANSLATSKVSGCVRVVQSADLAKADGYPNRHYEK